MIPRILPRTRPRRLILLCGLVPTIVVAALSLSFLAALGAFAARVGKSGVLKGAWRVTFWGAIAMGVTAGIGRLFGAVV